MITPNQRTMPAPTSAVLYLRSSKDRHDVSIEAQRRALGEFAASRGLAIVGEYADVVVSGKTEAREGWQRLLQELKAPGRPWSAVLMLDTSRLSRRQYVAHVFRHECAKRDVKVLFAMTPDVDGIAGIILPAVLHAMDEVHSFVSREKGVAGLAENVRRGYRAGGRAPWGYKLEYINTGAVREGRPVLKSKLALSEHAAIAKRYLQARAAGRGRVPLAAELELRISESSLVGVEWNALTYAGHTVWNVNQERLKHGYAGGTKRRPRADWVIQRDTHPALITDVEAEILLGRLERASVSKPRRRAADYLLTGLLCSSAGAAWYGNRYRYYRLGSVYVATDDVDRSVLGKISQDLRSAAFCEALLQSARVAGGKDPGGELQRLRAAESALDGRISKFMDMAANLETAGPVLRKVDELERDRKRLAGEIRRAEEDASAAHAARHVTGGQVQRWLTALAKDMQQLKRERLKDFLATICDRITLNPEGLTARIHYKIRLGQNNRLASPGPSDAIGHAKTSSSVRIKRAA